MAIVNKYNTVSWNVDTSRDLDSDFGGSKTFSLADVNAEYSTVQNRYAEYHNNQFGASTRFSTNTQRVVQKLVTEAINHNGITVRYMPRLGKYKETVFNETPEITYHRGMQIDALLESATGFDGSGIQISNVGLLFNQEVSLKISISRYHELFQTFLDALTDSDSRAYDRERPLEGDLIVIPFGRSAHNKNNYFPKFFEITECTTFMDAALYQLGDNFQFDIRARLFDLSSEDIEFTPVVQEYDHSGNVIPGESDAIQTIIERATKAYDSEGQFDAYSHSDHWDSWADNTDIEERAQVEEIWDEGKKQDERSIVVEDLTAHAFGMPGTIDNLDDI